MITLALHAKETAGTVGRAGASCASGGPARLAGVPAEGLFLDAPTRRAAYSKRRWESDPEYREATKARVRAWRKANPELAKQKAQATHKKRSAEKNLLSAAKFRAKLKGLSFEITEADIVIPKTCPVLGLPLICGAGKWRDCSPTLDRMDNSRGYVPGNVMVVSWRANRLKCDATLEEIELLYRHMKSLHLPLASGLSDNGAGQ